MLPKKRPFLRTLILLATISTLASASVLVLSPKDLRKTFESGYVKNTIADFGIVPYGHSISGTLLQAVPFTACSPLEMNKKKVDEITGNLIIIVQRGECNFSTKVIHAQNAGASAVIISDNDAIKDVHKIFAVERVKEQLDKIRVPSMLVSKVDADKLVDYMMKDQTVELGLNFELKKSENKSQLEYVLAVDDYRCYDSLLAMHRHSKAFKKQMQLVVHYKIFADVKVADSECMRSQGDNFCILNSYGNTLKDQGLMQETLRQMCVQRHAPQVFFYYLESVRKNCFDSHQSNIPIRDGFSDCARAVYVRAFGPLDNEDLDHKNVLDQGLGHSYADSDYGKGRFHLDDANVDHVRLPGIPQMTKLQVEKVATCSSMKGLEANEILRANNDNIKYYLINYSPLVFINGVYYKGNFDDVEHLFDAFCSSFETLPKACRSLASFHILQSSNTKFFFNHILKSLLLTSILIGVVLLMFFLFYQKRVRGRFDRELRVKISEAIATYYNTAPVDIEVMKFKEDEISNIDLFVKRVDLETNSVQMKEKPKSSASMPVPGSGGVIKRSKKGLDAKSMMNMMAVQDQMSDDDDDDQHPNNMTFG